MKLNEQIGMSIVLVILITSIIISYSFGYNKGLGEGYVDGKLYGSGVLDSEPYYITGYQRNNTYNLSYSMDGIEGLEELI